MKSGKIRVAARAPKSCFACYERKVKCNKRIPCNVCIERGQASSCHREVVMIRGVLHNNDDRATDASGMRKNLFEEAELIKENEELRRENKELRERLLSRNNLAPEKVEKRVFDFYGASIHVLARSSLSHDGKVEYTFDDFSQLAGFLQKEIAIELLRFNFKELYFLHCVVIPRVFMKEHENFWNNPAIPNKHVSSDVDRSICEYLWLSVYYALISNSLLLISDELLLALNLTEEAANRYGLIAWHACLECLHRGHFLKYPNIKSVQAFCILATAFHFVGGVNIANSTLTAMIYIARALNLHKLSAPNDQLDILNFELSCRMWWMLVILDSFEDFQRSIQIDLSEHTTPKPRNISDHNLFNLKDEVSDGFEAISYNLFIIEVACIKRQYYFDSGYDVRFSKQNLSSLYLANKGITSLATRFRDVHSNGNFDLARYLVRLKINFERLVINRSIMNHRPKDANSNEKLTCFECSLALVAQFVDKQYPRFYQKYWLSSEHTLNAAIFLLIYIIVDEDTLDIDTIKLLQDYLFQLEEVFRYNNSPISQGIAIIKKLFQLIVKKFNNESFKLEVAEIKCMLKELDDFQSIYQLDRNDSNDIQHVFIDTYWEEFLQWIYKEGMRQADV